MNRESEMGPGPGLGLGSRPRPVLSPEPHGSNSARSEKKH